MSQEEADLEKALDSVRAKVERLQEDIEPGEALEELEEVVAEVEGLGQRLEESGS